MATTRRGTTVQHLLPLVDAEAFTGVRDGDLLGRFVLHNEEAAFATLLRRHGPMVLNTCRRVLGQIEDAEDVFQATFLLLARKARDIRQQASVGGWLHRVAFRLAVEAKAQKRRRQAHERQAGDMRTKEPRFELAWRELQAVLGEELERLPEKHRAVLLLCYWEGKTQEEASHHLACPLGTVRSRLARARDLLQRRLARRGLALPGATLTTALVANAATAAVPATLLSPTLKAALLFAAGPAADGLSRQAMLFAERGLKAMFVTKSKRVLTVLLAAASFCLGTGILTFHAARDRIVQAMQAARPQPRVKEADKPKPAQGKGLPAVRHADALPAGAIARLGSLRFRHDHGGTAWCATAFSRDGKMLATCGGSIRLWEVATGKLLREIDGRFWAVGSLLFSPDSKVLAAQGEKEICLLNPATGNVLRRLRVEALSRALAFSPDGKLLATSGPSSGPKVGANFSVNLWSTATGRQFAVLRGHGRVVHSAAFTPDGRGLVSACWGNRVCRWDVGTGELRKSFDLPLPEGRTACLSPAGCTLAVAPPWPAPQPGDTDTLWDTETGRQRCAVPSERGLTNYGLAFSPDGTVLATDSTAAGRDQATISLWNVRTGKRITRFTAPARAAFVLNFAPDGRTLLSSGSEPQVRLWDTATGTQVFAESGHEAAITSLSFTPDGRALVSGADDGTLRVWDVTTTRLRRQLTGHRWGVHVVAVAADGKTALSGGADGCLRLYELDTGKECRRFAIGKQPEDLHQPQYHVLALGLAPGGRTAASWSVNFTREGSLFHLWNLTTGETLVHRADAAGVGRRLFSPDGKLVLTRADAGAAALGGAGGSSPGSSIVGSSVPFAPAQLALQEVATGRRSLQLLQPDHFGSVQAFAPDGRTLVTATGKMHDFARAPSDNHALHLWELATGRERLTITPGETGIPYGFEQVAFAPNGRTLATVRADQTIQLWDLVAGKELLHHTGYSARVCCLTFSPDGRALATGHADSSILLWDMTSKCRPQDQQADKPDARQLEHWWTDLADEDAHKAHAAVWGLSAVPQQALPLLRDRLRPAPAVSTDNLRRLIASLDSDEFKRREAGFAQLAALGEQAHAGLRAALKANPPIELRRRIEALLLDPGRVRSAEVVRHLRALEVLERLGSPEVQQIMETLTRGAPASRLTSEAKAALTRLSQKTVAKPLH